MQCVQIQDAASIEALQAVCCIPICHLYCSFIHHSSFELGGEKKTKGAALQFVRGFCPTVPFVSDAVVKVRLRAFVVSISCLFRHVSTTAL